MTIGILMEQEKVSKSEFKARALEFLRQVETSGGHLIVTDHGKATLEIRRYRDQERSPLEVLKGSVIQYEDPTEPVGDQDWDALR